MPQRSSASPPTPTNVVTPRSFRRGRPKPQPAEPRKSSARVLAVIMGHSTIAMTFDTYGHLMPGGLDEARTGTDAYLAQLGDGRRLRLAA
jgi:hypothetical protein